MKYDELKSVFSTLNGQLKRFEDRVGYDAEGLYPPADANERQLHRMARHIVDRLYDVSWQLTYLEKDILWEGSIAKQPNGRYRCGSDGVELTSGNPVEVYIEDDETWELSTVEHNGTDYYIKVLGSNAPIDGVCVRVRK